MNITEQHDPKSQRYWNMKWFAYLAAPLLFVTIILPIMAGPIFRQLLQWYIRLRNFWRVGFVISWILYTIATFVIFYCGDDSWNLWIPGQAMVWLYNIGFLGITLLRLYSAWRAVRSQQGGMRYLAISISLVVGGLMCVVLTIFIGVVPYMEIVAWIALPLIMMYIYRLDARRKRTRTSKEETST